VCFLEQLRIEISLKKSQAKSIENLQKQLYNNSEQTRENKFKKAHILESHSSEPPENLIE
jgi:hypothetical protein